MNDVVICLFGDAGFDRAAQGLAGAGSRLAARLGGRLRMVVVDQEYQPEACLAALTRLCGELAPRAVLLSNDTYCQEIAPRLAHRLGGSAAGDGVELHVEGGAVRVGRQVYGGKAHAIVELKRSPAVVWLRARAFAPAAESTDTTEILRLTFDAAEDSPTRIVERATEQTSESRLEDARVIVSGGRGLGGPEPFESELRPLAELIGAQMAASRAACDAGWVSPTWQVGQTGKKVAPDLYLAIALSGASQHLAGISEAKTIAAINSDPDAPIFKHSKFGIVDDYRKVVPLLREKLAALPK